VRAVGIIFAQYANAIALAYSIAKKMIELGLVLLLPD
jgi:hypothetical protein